MKKIESKYGIVGYVTNAEWAAIDAHQKQTEVELLEFTFYKEPVEDFTKHSHQVAGNANSTAKPHRWSLAE